MSMWWNDFSISSKEVYVKTTGARVPVTWARSRDVLTFFTYYLTEKLYGARRLLKRPAYKIACIPARPRAWYLIWAAAYRANIDLNAALHEADAILFFEDKTRALNLPDTLANKPGLNQACIDISKTHVQDVFEQVFGYALAVDPLTHNGPMVEKSDLNGAHDGRIIHGPLSATKTGHVYQRVIDNQKGESVLDLRCPTVGGHIDLIYLKRRPAARRFENLNTSCVMAVPSEYLSNDERAKLSEFCAAMHLDWGGLDVLRDKTDGRIYVVDVNKTDMGPPLALPLKDKLASVTLLSHRLTHVLNAKIANSL